MVRRGQVLTILGKVTRRGMGVGQSDCREHGKWQ